MLVQTSDGHKYRLAKQPHTIFTVSSRTLSTSFHSGKALNKHRHDLQPFIFPERTKVINVKGIKYLQKNLRKDTSGS